MTKLSRVPTSTATPVRSRAPRAIEVDAQTRPEYFDEIENYVRLRDEKNEKTRLEGASKKKLEKLLAVADKTEVEHLVGNKTYTVTFKPGEADYVDPVALLAKVGIEELLKVVTVSQSAVKDAFGSNVLAAVLKTKATDASLKVAEKK